MVGAGAGLPVYGCRASRAAAALLAVSASMLFGLAQTRPALAQQNPLLTFQNQGRPTPTGKSITAKPAPGAQMLVQANEMRYDYNNLLGPAVGNVQHSHIRATISAAKRTY